MLYRSLVLRKTWTLLKLHNSKRNKSVTFPELETELLNWFFRYESKTVLSDEIIIKKGKRIVEKLNIKENELCYY